MKDHLTIGSTPCMEDCAQVGSPDYYDKAPKECARFKKMLLDKFGEPPFGAYLTVKGFPHDFGSYYEVCAVYDDADVEGFQWALFLEGNTPEYWNDTDPVNWRDEVEFQDELDGGSVLKDYIDPHPNPNIPECPIWDVLQRYEEEDKY